MSKPQRPQFDFSPIQREFIDENWCSSPQDLADSLTELYMDVCEIALAAAQQDPGTVANLRDRLFALRMLIESLNRSLPIN